MMAFVKRRSDFKTIFYAEAVSWETPIASVSNDSGTIEFSEILDQEVVEIGSFLIFLDDIWLIDKIEPIEEENKTTITVVDLINLFDRPLFYTSPGSSIGGFISSEINSKYKNISDPAYALSYLNVTNEDNTTFVIPIHDEETKLYTLSDYIFAMRQHFEVACEFQVDGDILKIRLYKKPKATHTILESDGHFKMLSQVYSKNITAKVTVLQGDTSTDFYLSTDGAVSNTIPTNRADGEWVVIQAHNDVLAIDAAVEEFLNNSNSHKIEFLDDRYYDIHDKVVIRTKNKLITTAISFISTSSADHRYMYKCGELATTMTEKVRNATTSNKNDFSTLTSAKLMVGDIFITTREGNPADLLGYGEWELIIDRTLIGAGGEYPAGTTGGSATHKHATQGYSLTIAQMPSHGHKLTAYSINAGEYDATNAHLTYKDGTTTMWVGESPWWLDYTGGDQPHDHGDTTDGSSMPPFYAVYIWLRIA